LWAEEKSEMAENSGFPATFIFLGALVPLAPGGKFFLHNDEITPYFVSPWLRVGIWLLFGFVLELNQRFISVRRRLSAVND